jgi:hypothetical protein
MKYCALFLVSFFFLNQSFSQATIGIRGGIGLSKFTTSTIPNTSAVAELSAGAYIAMPIGKNLFFQPEIMFNCIGQKYVLKGLYQDTKYLTRLYYLDLPLLLKYEVKSLPVPLYFLAGPYAGLLIDGRRVQNYKTEYYSGFRTYYHKADCGMAFGGGTYFDTKFGKIAAELRLAKGFVNIATTEIYAPKGTTFLAAVYISYILNINDVFGPAR